MVFMRIDGLSCGADIVVQSTHKTLLAMSQCAMMHLNEGINIIQQLMQRSTSQLDGLFGLFRCISKAFYELH